MQISHLFGKQLYNLSGGERKLTHIARCLISEKAKAYILDEPFASVDIFYQQRICFLLKNIAKNKKCIIISTHDINLALRLACRMIILHEKIILADGKPCDIVNEELVKTLYGIRSHIFNDKNGHQDMVI